MLTDEGEALLRTLLAEREARVRAAESLAAEAVALLGLLLNHTTHDHPGARKDGTKARCRLCALGKSVRAFLRRPEVAALTKKEPSNG